jgi:2-oxoglutarate ferredoxin oxidoreductase subunit alpha
MREARAKGLKVGLMRPITLWPFPYAAITELSKKVKHVVVVEMSLGQMIEDVKLAVLDRAKIHFHGRPGGGVPQAAAISEIISYLMEKGNKAPITTRGTVIDWQIS